MRKIRGGKVEGEDQLKWEHKGPADKKRKDKYLELGRTMSEMGAVQWRESCKKVTRLKKLEKLN